MRSRQINSNEATWWTRCFVEVFDISRCESHTSDPLKVSKIEIYLISMIATQIQICLLLDGDSFAPVSSIFISLSQLFNRYTLWPSTDVRHHASLTKTSNKIVYFNRKFHKRLICERIDRLLSFSQDDRTFKENPETSYPRFHHC